MADSYAPFNIFLSNDPKVEWIKLLGTVNDEFVSDLIRHEDGSIVISGSTNGNFEDIDTSSIWTNKNLK